MTDANHYDVTTEGLDIAASNSVDVTAQLREEIDRLRQECEQLSSALLWATRQLGLILDASLVNEHGNQTGQSTISLFNDQTGTREPDGLLDQDPTDIYPLNASEDRSAYHLWLRERRQSTIVGGPDDPVSKKPTTPEPRHVEPLISVIIPVFNTPRWALERCVGSVFRQRFADWEICICDDASGNPELTHYLTELARCDRRIKVTTLDENSGISAATNAALALASGTFVAFLDHDDELTVDALGAVARAIATTPNADFLYSDEDKIDASGERFDPLFKPDWSPDLLMSFAYTCHFTVIARDLVKRIGGLRSEFDGSQDYDLALRASEQSRQIVHISEVLYHWRTLPGSAATDTTQSIAKPWAYEAGRRALEDALRRRGETGSVAEDIVYPGRYHVHRDIIGRPRVSIVIPFRDEPALLATCVRTMRMNPGYNNYEFVLIDNNSELPETEALLDQLNEEPDVIVVRYPEPFNWSAVNNFGAQHATGDVLLFSNNDIEARRSGWLSALVSHAVRPDVGAVGAKLLYPDGTIQHAGVVIGLGGIAGHILRGLPAERPGYNSTSISTRDCSVVTGACLMTRREIFEEVGGFSEELAVAFNDVDFCLQIRARGYRIVFTPLAELIHHESRSRGHTDDLLEHRVVVSRWANEIVAGDPYLNKNLSHWRYWCPLSTPQEDYRWKTYLERSILTQRASSSD